MTFHAFWMGLSFMMGTNRIRMMSLSPRRLKRPMYGCSIKKTTSKMVFKMRYNRMTQRPTKISGCRILVPYSQKLIRSRWMTLNTKRQKRWSWADSHHLLSLLTNVRMESEWAIRTRSWKEMLRTIIGHKIRLTQMPLKEFLRAKTLQIKVYSLATCQQGA